ncbi:MAG: DNA replication/repair protein RecF [Microbacteriaceae bacterium]|nr:DNA replication/repair protein RecF [Microbacteriaceae bacterium]
MHITRLRLAEYRNHVSSDIHFSPGVTLFIGPNGQGKTNVVEAIHVLAFGSSHRTHQSAALINQHATTSVVAAELTHQDRTMTVDISLERNGSNRARANGHPIRVRDLPRYLHAVIFSPEDLRIIRDDPDERRGFIDDVISVLWPRLSAVISDYERVLKQRNSLLKSLRSVPRAQRDLSTLAIWDEKIVSLGTEILFARQAGISALHEPVVTAYRNIVGSEHPITLTMRSRVMENVHADASRDLIADKFTVAMIAALEDDLDRGMTSVGPHRDDVDFELNSLPVKGYASQGETWSYALALKLATAELFRHDALGDPIVILDDVFAELDVHRRHNLAASLSSFEQILVTAAVKDDIPPLDIRASFTVSRGIVEKAELT